MRFYDPCYQQLVFPSEIQIWTGISCRVNEYHFLFAITQYCITVVTQVLSSNCTICICKFFNSNLRKFSGIESDHCHG